MKSRSPYLVTKALKTFMWGSILAAVSSQIATTTDAIVVSNLIGPAAISAINLMTPILTLFSCLMIFFGIGASIQAAKAIGRRDEKGAHGIFTASILSAAASGIILALIVFIFSPFIAGLLTGGDEVIYAYALSYLQVMCVCVPFLMMAGVVENFVKTDGNPRIVMIAVLSGGVMNLVLDIVFVKFLDMGIAGSAWATGINYLVATLICMWHFKNPTSSLKWYVDTKMVGTYVRQSVAQGLPMGLNTLLLSGCIMALNAIVLMILGATGIYCWSVCVQLFLILQMVLAGVGSSIYTMGGVLVGEQDMRGYSFLTVKTILIACGALGAITVLILIFPGFFGELFGSRSDDPNVILHLALRAFSIMFVPYAFVALLRSDYQILGRIRLSLFLSVAQLLFMVGFVWGFALLNDKLLWWGFPSSSGALSICLIIYSFFERRKNPDLEPITLIPRYEDKEALNISVKMDSESVANADRQVADFLKSQNLDQTTIYDVRLSCEELMHNIVNHAVARHPEKHFFDLHIRVGKNEVSVLLKDDGRPFNPVITGENLNVNPENMDSKIGLKIVNLACRDINYKYMYDQNMVMLKFPFAN